MPKFEIYTYQFQRILKCTQTEIDFEGIPKSVCTDEQWNDRQKLFGKLFKPGVKLEFKSGRSPVIYEVLYDANSIIVLRIANEKVKFISGADFKPKSVKDYPWCYVVFDNRDGIQRMLISRNKKAWDRTDIPARILYRTFDKLMLKEGMHFNPGDRPIYPKHEFWEVVKSAHQGVNRVLFKFPPTNLGRLLNLADNIDAIRHETGAGINVDMIAPKGGVVNLQQDMVQTDAMVGLGAAAGYEVKVWPKGVRTPQTVGKESVTVEIPESLLNKLGDGDMFDTEIIEKLIAELNRIKTLYA